MMQSSKFLGQKMGGTMQGNTEGSKLTAEQLQRSQHAMTKESLLKPPGKLGGTPGINKPYNRLVPVPPPQSFMTSPPISEEPKKSKI